MPNIIEPSSEGDAYVICASGDTIEMFFRCRQLPSGIRKSIEKSHGQRIGIKRCLTKDGHLQGHRVYLNGPPSAATIAELDRWQALYHGVVSRFDVAYDFPADMQDYIKTHAVLRWRRKGSMKEFDNGGIYWISRPRTNRNLLLYMRESKVTGQPCAHFELRFHRASACRREGIRRASDLLMLDPLKLFNKHIGWSDMGDGFVAKAVKATVAADNARERERIRMRQSRTPFMERFMNGDPTTGNKGYRDGIKRKAAILVQKAGYDRAQLVKDARTKPVRLKTIPLQVEMPDHLTWA
jgi:hypothetical protein